MVNEKDTKPCEIINLQDYCNKVLFDNKLGPKAGDYLQRQHRTQVRLEIAKFEERNRKDASNGQ